MPLPISPRTSAVALVFALAACGGGGSPASPGTSPASGPAGAGVDPNLSGTIAISGSSTVQPISQAVQELFNEQAPGVAITVDGPGTGDGFKLFCNGEIDISDASRKIREEEAQACGSKGIEYVELKVAIDGLSVLTSGQNDQVTCLTFADLYALLGPESQAVRNWKDAQPLASELGSKTQLPDAELQVYGPGEESGTYDSFVEIVLGDLAEERKQEAQTRADYQSSPNDNVIVEGVAGFPTSLGWVGYAFAEDAATGGNVTLLEIDDGESGCVAPTAETIASGDYPISRDLFIYVDKAKAAQDPALQAYVDFYLAEGTLDQVLEDVPYVGLTDEAMAQTRATWESRSGSS